MKDRLNGKPLTLQQLQDLYESGGFVMPESKEGIADESQAFLPACFADELLLNKAMEIPTLLHPIFPKQGLIALAGSSDTGKSALLRQFAIAVSCHEEHFLGFPIRATHHQAIYVSTEDDELAVRFLLHKQNEGKNYEPARYRGLRFIFESENVLAALDYHLSQIPADVVVVDAFSDLFYGSLNQTNEVRKFLNTYKQLADKHACLIVFLHHTGKTTDRSAPSKHNLLGSQGFEAKMRLVVELRKDQSQDEIRHFCLVKGNYLPKEHKNASYVLRFDEHMLFHNTWERADFEALIETQEEPVNEREQKMNLSAELSRQGKTQREIASLTGLSLGAVNKYLKIMSARQSQQPEESLVQVHVQLEPILTNEPEQRTLPFVQVHVQNEPILLDEPEQGTLPFVQVHVQSEHIPFTEHEPEQETLSSVQVHVQPEHIPFLNVNLNNSFLSLSREEEEKKEKEAVQVHVQSEHIPVAEHEPEHCKVISFIPTAQTTLSPADIIAELFREYAARSKRMVINLMRCDYGIPEEEGNQLFEQLIAEGYLHPLPGYSSPSDPFFEFKLPKSEA